MSLIGIPEFGFEKCTLFNLYAPNDNKVRADFFRQVQTELKLWGKNRNCDQLIITADFSCIVDKDDKGTNNFNHNDESVREMKSLINLFSLKDVWQKFNPGKKQFIRRQLDQFNCNRNVAVRLDRWYVSSKLLPNVENATLLRAKSPTTCQ